MEKSTLRSFNQLFDDFIQSLEALETPPLGPEFKKLSSAELHEALVVHRMRKCYEIPNPGAANSRKELSIMEVINNDKNGWDHFDYRELNHESRRDFLLSREWLRRFFKGFVHSYRLRFPSNETYISARGRTDLIYKLNDLKQWTVSPDAVKYVVEILLRERALLAVVKQRFKAKHGELGRLELKLMRNEMLQRGFSTRDIRRESVRYMFRACCKLVRVSRVTTVPKDNNRDRVITCECLWTMVAQLSYAASLRDHMRKVLGIDLDSLQGVHRALIRSGAATIDLSKASDRNFMVVLDELWPKSQVRYLRALRTGIFEVKETDGITYHPLRMLAPMGCGFTFEVMTLTLLSHTRVLDPGSSVFGDDIIIKGAVADRLIHNLEANGWKINVQKSFIDGPFRESCGAFCDLRTNKLLLSYDFHRAETLADCYILAHKLLQLGGALPRGRLRTLISKLYAELHFVFPRDSLVDIYSVAYRPTAGLTDRVFYALREVASRRRTPRKTAPSRCLEKFWQRPVTVQQVHTFKDAVKMAPAMCDRTHTAAYLRRGASYDVPTGRRKPVVVGVDLETGTPLRDVLLASVV